MGILDRVRLAMLRRELAALKAADREARNAMTTHDMMAGVVENARRIVHIENKIRVIEGVEDAHDDDDGFGDTRIPSSMFIPSKQDPP